VRKLFYSAAQYLISERNFEEKNSSIFYLDFWSFCEPAAEGNKWKTNFPDLEKSFFHFHILHRSARHDRRAGLPDFYLYNIPKWEKIKQMT
jgi:hypothetical protein